MAFVHRHVLTWQVRFLWVRKEKIEGDIFEASFFIPYSCQCLRIIAELRSAQVKWMEAFFPSPTNVCFSVLFRISSQCPASDYGCSSPTVYSGGKASRVHASINSDFSTAFMSCNSRRAASSHCYNGPSCDLLCKLCKWIHPHEPGHSRRSSWSSRSSVGLSWWPPR